MSVALERTTNEKDNLPRSSYKRKTIFLWAAPIFLSVVVTAMPAQAIFGELGDIIWGLVDEYLLEDLNLGEWQAIFDEIVNGNGSCLEDIPILSFLPMETGEYCAGGGSGGGDNIGGALGDIVVDTVGEMGVPDPNEARREIEKATTSNPEQTGTGDIFEINKVVWGVSAANQLDRDLTRVQISTVLGEAGQKATKQQIDAAQETVKDSAQTADDAQSLDVTQDVMKEQIKVTAQQTLLLGGLRADSLQAKNDTQFTNMNLENSSRTLDELARAERVKSSSNAMSLSSASGLAQLN
jgi:hypothetical protein